MHPLWVALLVAGSVWGWVFKRLHYSHQDWRGAIARHRNATRVFRRECLWSAGALVVALLVLHALL